MPVTSRDAAEHTRHRVRYRTVTADEAGQRVDNFLQRELKGVPKSRLYRMLRKGEVRVNRKRIRAAYRVQAGDVLRLPPVRTAHRLTVPSVSAALQQLLRDALLRETPDWLVLDKPSGLAVHGGSGVRLGVIEALRQLRPDEKHLELVHRLDRDTSGCLLVARNRPALRALQAQWRDARSEKTYLALVQGRWPAHQRSVRAPLQKNVLRSGERLVRVAREGRDAETRFSVVSRYATATLVRATLVTGRTHQIRVHARHAGHPIAGDPRYGDEAFNRSMKAWGLKRLFLHAERLGFTDPASGEHCTVSAPLPPTLTAVLEQLERDA